MVSETTLHEHDDNCEGCLPALLNVKTLQPLPKDHPCVVAATKAFKEKTTLTQRRAWHRIVMGQSQNETDLAIADEVSQIIAEAIEELK